MNYRRLAILTGSSIIVMAVLAGFSIGYAFLEFNQVENEASVRDLLLMKTPLYFSMVMSLLFIVFLDLAVSYTLYKFFEKDNKRISILAGVFRFIYTLIFGIAIFYLAKNLQISGVTNHTILRNYQLFETIWSFGLIVFGCHLVLIGYLMRLHKMIPKLLWLFALMAGGAYILVHALKFSNINPDFLSNLEMVLAFPMAFGELGLAGWLIYRGNQQKP